MPNITTLTGPSGSGKSEIINMIINANKEKKYKIIPKYTTRLPREEDGEEIRCVDKLPIGCDMVYGQYGKEYGFATKHIADCFKRGYNPVLIVNNTEVLKKLQCMFGKNVNSYFIHRKKPSLEGFKEIAQKRNAFDEEDVEKRYEVASKIYKIYTDDVKIFDSIILNIGTLDQTRNIVNQLVSDTTNTATRDSNLKSNRIFIIAGNPGSGKDIVIKQANKLGAREVSKHTSRTRNEDDGSEMVCFGDEGFDLEGCDFKYTNFDTEYGIKTDEIWDNLMTETSQIVVVSNIEAIKELKRIFGDFAVPMYVHSDITPEEYRKEIQEFAKPEYIEARIENFQQAHEQYSLNPTLFERTLIYANDERELIQQTKNIIESYKPNMNKDFTKEGEDR